MKRIVSKVVLSISLLVFAIMIYHSVTIYADELTTPWFVNKDYPTTVLYTGEKWQTQLICRGEFIEPSEVEKYYSDDKKVVTINKKGIVTAKNYGDTTIHAITKSGYDAELKIFVREPRLSRKEITVRKGRKYQLEMKGRTVTKYTSSNKNQVKVSKTGLISAKKTTQIPVIVTAICDTGETFECKVSVTDTPLAAKASTPDSNHWGLLYKNEKKLEYKYSITIHNPRFENIKDYLVEAFQHGARKIYLTDFIDTTREEWGNYHNNNFFSEDMGNLSMYFVTCTTEFINLYTEQEAFIEVSYHPGVVLVHSMVLKNYPPLSEAVKFCYSSAMEICATSLDELQRSFEEATKIAETALRECYTDEEIMFYLHDYIFDNITYYGDSDFFSNDEDVIRPFPNCYYYMDIRGPMLYHLGNCMGSTNTLLTIFTLLGYRNNACESKIHAWNEVYVSGEWFNIDPIGDRLYYDDYMNLPNRDLVIASACMRREDMGTPHNYALFLVTDDELKAFDQRDLNKLQVIMSDVNW